MTNHLNTTPPHGQTGELPRRIWIDWKECNRQDNAFDEPPHNSFFPCQDVYVRADIADQWKADAKAHEKEIAVWAENYAALERERDTALAEVERMRTALEHIITSNEASSFRTFPNDYLASIARAALTEGEKP
jgi:hypothetical protein